MGSGVKCPNRQGNPLKFHEPARSVTNCNEYEWRFESAQSKCFALGNPPSLAPKVLRGKIFSLSC